MGYEQLYNEFNIAPPFEASFTLDSQPTYAIIGALISLLLLSMSTTVTSSKTFANTNFIIKFISFAIVSAVTALFCGITAVFTSNSFGVYI
ncbi:hypothetical protein TPHA_0E02550 [Tetrapisispora phaffii CBS 4417]|uniref:Dolichyl-diphosphooligosaccharide-protein glycosyltransferase subunit OST5 n=1 Tax=Tetrapisispora phaffii (strain ATCC 24235 / CBS 4417 / NBRC 1672 / NRRL Y-8282 / UCD 70-5) TaxID=1071381 RepID=G8BTW9_TETPH|nr:hypothetical protein TPHA_0E02550 [Tetrapisispora phaffii CBS 4417]CCE63347.1 hypothetical protein TPHA_0E02550 [Tetrapisispora phaffii CBS 4417]